jgi:hypothetical protein
MGYKIWGILFIIIGSVIYKLSVKYLPHPQDDFGMHMLAYEISKRKLFLYIFYLIVSIPPVLWLLGIILGFMDAWYIGIIYIIISIALWLAFSAKLH